MGLLYPELLLLLAPLWAAHRRWGGGATWTGALRGLILALLCLAAAGPYLPLADPGHDVVVVVDRSLSMPQDADGRVAEILRLVEAARAPGDRVGVVLVGARARVLRAPSEVAVTTDLPPLDGAEAMGSDLAAGLDAALALLPRGRAGRLLLVSDGLADGRDPIAVARKAGSQGVAIDVRALSRPAAPDTAVSALEAPSDVSTGEPFALTAWIQADAASDVRYALYRGDQVIRRGSVTLKPGTNRLILRDMLSDAGVQRYALRLEGLSDPVPEDDVGLAAVRGSGPRPVLALTEAGAESALTEALARAGLEVEVRAPEGMPHDLVSLSRFRAVVLENVEAARLGPGMEALAGFVSEQGGGLLLTGGRASFGVGGYHASEIDPLLPVSMEMRLEQRKQALALVVAMDRSGSMGVEVDGGRTKMDLANLGAAEAIRLLSPIDHVGVLAVDTAAHVVAPLQPAKGSRGLVSDVLRVRSEGGGIYVKTAIVAAAKMLERAPQANRHITLFSDAADSEEQEGALALTDKLVKAGVTVSVIALGSRFDSDARFLEELAARGRGTVAFTMRPSELPRLFAQDTLLASKATLVEEPVATTPRADLRAIGVPEQARGPALRGYNLTWTRPDALVGLVTQDENKAPVLAWRLAGAGRTAAYTGQVGGSWGQEALGWEGFAPTVAALGRWLVASEPPEGWFATATREGQEALVRVERDPGRASAGAPRARLRGPDGRVTEVELQPVAPDVWEGRARLGADGVTLGAVLIGEDEAIPLPPLAMAWPAELSPPADPEAGDRTLRRVASASGGAVNGPLNQLFSGEVAVSVGRVLTAHLAGLAVALLVLEIAGRRLWGWAERPLRRPRRIRDALQSTTTDAIAPSPEAAPRRGDRSTGPQEPAAHPASPPAPAATPGIGDALSRARKAADRNLKR